VGRIAAALLLAGDHDSSNLIEEATLLRIKHALEEEISSKGFLQAARDSVSAFRRSGVRGATPIRPGSAISSVDTPVPPALLRRPAIVPTLSLEPEGPTRWRLLLHSPDCLLLREHLPGVRQWLETCRCKIAGTKDGYQARGFLTKPRSMLLTR